MLNDRRLHFSRPAVGGTCVGISRCISLCSVLPLPTALRGCWQLGLHADAALAQVVGPAQQACGANRIELAVKGRARQQHVNQVFGGVQNARRLAAGFRG